jgi:hypothetical protein
MSPKILYTVKELESCGIVHRAGVHEFNVLAQYIYVLA